MKILSEYLREETDKLASQLMRLSELDRAEAEIKSSRVECPNIVPRLEIADILRKLNYGFINDYCPKWMRQKVDCFSSKYYRMEVKIMLEI